MSEVSQLNGYCCAQMPLAYKELCSLCSCSPSGSSHRKRSTLCKEEGEKFSNLKVNCANKRKEKKVRAYSLMHNQSILIALAIVNFISILHFLCM